MPLSVKRRVSAWLLLLVFVPIMVATSLHTHEDYGAEVIECEQCAHHVHHAGHFNTSSGNVHDCVLCQFASLPYVAASTLIISAALLPNRIEYATITRRTSIGVCDVKSTRAPPLF